MTGVVEPCALTFTEAWAYVLRTPEVRAWAFERRLPTASELLLAHSRGPFLRTFFMDASRQYTGGFTGKFYTMRHDEIFCCVCALPDGTRLGYVLNAQRQDVCAPVFGQHDAQYLDASHQVQKLIVAAPAPTRQLFVLELNWLKSGALLIRFQPCCRLGLTLRLAMTVRVFTPRDASRLAIAGGDFRIANLSDARYRLDCVDTAFQSSCIFCTARGLLVCACPMPMRRRGASPMRMFGYVAQDSNSLWDELCTVMTAGVFTGSALHNITRRLIESVTVVDANITPFKISVQNVTSHPALQSYLSLTGSSAVLERPLLSYGFEVTSGSKSSFSDETDTLLQLPTGSGTERSAVRSVTVSNDSDNVSCAKGMTETNTVIATCERQLERVKKSNKRYLCPICGITIRYKKSNLQRHISNIHERSRRFRCTEIGCGKLFQTNSNLRRHQKIVHKITEDEGERYSSTADSAVSPNTISAIQGKAG